MTSDDRAFRKEIRREAEKIRWDGAGGTSQLMREMMANWKEFNPAMHRRLEALGILEDYALVLENRYLKAVGKMIVRGINPSDAEREASELLLMTSEAVEDEETTT